jgi:hypothetical protein
MFAGGFEDCGRKTQRTYETPDQMCPMPACLTRRRALAPTLQAVHTDAEGYLEEILNLLGKEFITKITQGLPSLFLFFIQREFPSTQVLKSWEKPKTGFVT